MHNEKVEFQKTECLVKAVKVYNEKAECLTSIYKSDNLRDKLPKRIICI